MNIAVQSPNFLFSDPARSFTGYDFEFAKNHASVIYLPGWRWTLTRGNGYKKLLRSIGIDPDLYEFAFTIRELNRKADVLVSFNYLPHAEENRPPRRFAGLKVWHTMDFVFNAPMANRALESGGVDAVMGYCHHGRHSAFFRAYYPRYVERVIPVPFGFASRFTEQVPFRRRTSKVVALGSVNPLDEKSIPPAANVNDYVRFYSQEMWTHRWRRMLVEQHAEVADLVDSHLPKWPETKNPEYDAVALLNQYALFANDEGLMAFPPARTYEGIAAGCVMVANKHQCFEEFGFQDGVNCILHHPQSISNFRERVRHYLCNPEKLEAVANAGTALVRRLYPHSVVARGLAQRLQALMNGRMNDAFANWAGIGSPGCDAGNCASPPLPGGYAA